MLKSQGILWGIPEMAISWLKHDLITAICETAAWGGILGGKGSKYNCRSVIRIRDMAIITTPGESLQQPLHL